MSSHADLQRQLSDGLQTDIVRMTPISGGDINEAYKLDLPSQPPLFVKTNARAPAGMFAAEAAGLAWLAEADAIKVPQVVAVSDATSPAFLALRYEPPGKPGADFTARLGRQLAALHAAGAPQFGWVQNNFIGTLPQDNRSHGGETWAAFYGQRRLEPLLRRAHDEGCVSPQLNAQFQQLFTRLPDLVGPPEPPARLHGDLWAGNHMCNLHGEPVLFDPAVYGGHREVDLAMMRLFGGYAEATFAAYHEAFPLASGHQRRVALYQLYPLLVHVVLFQGSYVSQVQAAVRAALAA